MSASASAPNRASVVASVGGSNIDVAFVPAIGTFQRRET